MKQYRCLSKVSPACDTENWHDEGTGPHPARRAGVGTTGIEWREKPAAEYLGDFGPNAMREAAMERVGELEAGDIAYYGVGAAPFDEDTLKQAVRDVYVRERTTPFFDALRLSVKEAEAVMLARPGDVIRADSFGDTPEERAKFPMFDGLLAYFPAALAWVSRCSFEGNQQHNAGQPMHWAMDKSTDHENKILRHLMAGFTDDKDRVPHSVKVAWRALARAQEDLMRRYGAPMPPNARRAHPERGNPVKQTDEE